MKSTLRKNLIFFVGLIICFFIVDRTLALVLDKVISKSNFRFSKLYQGQMDNEILFIGNSRGVNSFYQPEIENITGKRAFNLSYNGLSAEFCKILIKDYCRYNEKPNKIYLEVTTANTETSSELLSSMKLFFKYSPELDSLARTLDRKSHRTQFFSHLFRYNSEFTFRILYYLKNKDQQWINGGNISDFLFSETQNMNPVNFNLTDQSLKDLVEIDAFCKKNNIEVVYVLGPYLPNYLSKIENLDSWIQQVERTLNTKILNYSSALENRNNFADRIHLNKKGGIEFAKILFKEL